jgi:peptidyl-dipeptidase Dcp
VSNPLLAAWTGPYGLPPFAAVRAEHFAPAFAASMAEHLAEIDAIGGAGAAPTFANTVAALDSAGRLFERIGALFHNLTSSETSPALQAVEREMAPVLAAHDSRVYTHAALFARIDALHSARASLGLSDEQSRVLERYHLDFLRAGAKLAPPQRVRYAEVMQRLAELTTRFGQNVLADESEFQLVLEGEADLVGLPAFVRIAARQAASERGLTGVSVITLARSHIVPFLSFSERRDLRETAWRAWTSRGEHPGASDNRRLAQEILQLRVEQAHLHGYASYADFALTDTMAKSQAAVAALLERVWKPARARAEEERADLALVARAHGHAAAIEPWDWRFYAEKVRRQRFDLDEAEIKPYFSLEGMVGAAFDCAARLFGVRFVSRPQIQAYHPDVRVYEVQNAAGIAIGLFLHDNFARPTKRSGAWMSAYRMQSKNGGDGATPVLPIIVNNNNFAKGSPAAPTLLSFDDARTLFHEFGHGLHGLLSNVTYERVSGTNVLRDFVELPSQLFEHWLEQPEVLKRHARHYQTGAPIADVLIDRLHAARHFNQGYETVRYAASALVDMAAHARTERGPIDVVAFERKQFERLGLPPGVGVNHRLTHFQHLFSGSAYAAGYYVYLWAEVLDADGFEAFVEAGDLFDPEVARRLARFIYSSGNSIEPGAAYRAFRGRAAKPEPMLRQRGLLEPAAG